jgi:hypothetical protein
VAVQEAAFHQSPGCLGRAKLAHTRVEQVTQLPEPPDVLGLAPLLGGDKGDLGRQGRVDQALTINKIVRSR